MLQSNASSMIVEKLHESLLSALKNNFVRKYHQRWVDLVQQSGITVN
jgi:hypothetical protein